MRRMLMAVLALAWVLTSAQAETKIATINLKRVFDGCWKTKAAAADLRGRTEEYDQDFRRLFEQYQKANEAYRQLVAKINDTTITADEKKKLDNAGRAKVDELREMETEVNQFLQHSRTMLNEKQQRLRNNIVNEISVVVASKAVAGAYDLVLDTSGETSNLLPSVVYTSGKNDLTEAVLADLNANAPADLTSPDAAAPSPAPAPAPAPPKEQKKPEEKPAKPAPKN